MIACIAMVVARPALAAPVQPQAREAAEVPLAVSDEGTEGIDDPMSRVASLINGGQALFDTADFTGAIDKWTQAYAELPDSADILTARNLLTYQIAQAHIEAHAIDGQPTHLRKAERLLSRYIEGLAPEEAEARASAELLRDKLRAQIATAPPPLVIAEAPPPPPSAIDAPRRASPLTLAGEISLGFGAAALLVTMIAAFEGRRVDRDGDLGLAPQTDHRAHGLAALKHHHGGDAHDVKLHRQRLSRVDVELADLSLAHICGRHFLDRRGQHAARPAPLSPEIYQHRLLT